MKYFIIRRRYKGLVKDFYKYVVCYEGYKNPCCYITSFASLSSARAYCNRHDISAEYLGNKVIE